MKVLKIPQTTFSSQYKLIFSPKLTKQLENIELSIAITRNVSNLVRRALEATSSNQESSKNDFFIGKALFAAQDALNQKRYSLCQKRADLFLGQFPKKRT